MGRRELLRAGALGLFGLGLPELLRGRAAGGAPRPGKARACILVFNYGGPSHLDTWDLKPAAPREIRGEFKPIRTRVPGTMIGEHLPRLASRMDRLALVRSIHHDAAPIHETGEKSCSS